MRSLAWNKNAEREQGREAGREIAKSVPQPPAAQLVGSRWENDDVQIRWC